MWGCLRLMVRLFVFGTLLLLVFLVAVPWLVQTARFEEYVLRRVKTTLEARLGREVMIGRIEVHRTQLFEPTKVILHDVRIANLHGSMNPYFATVRRVEITGGVDSFRRRIIRVGRIDIIEPRVYFEIFPEGARYTHNFPRWTSGPRSRWEIVRVQFGRLFARDGNFLFLDRRHQITAEATRLATEMTITSAENLYEGVVTSPLLRFRLQEYEPVELDLRGGFRYTPGVLALQSIALRGPGLETFVSGRLDPVAQAVYDLRLASKLDLARVREVFRLNRTLDGTISLDTNLRGKQADFTLTGNWVAPQMIADTYELADAEGRLTVTGKSTTVDVERVRYGGGTIGAHYTLARYGEPYPMTVDLRYTGISIEEVFTDWGVENTGLRGAATGSLSYEWNKDRLLAGSGRGTARLSKNATAFSRARYPIPISGATDFLLNDGVVTFRNAELDTAESHLSLGGSLRIEGLVTNFNVRIQSRDFSELDRAAYNFAHAAGKRDFKLLGLGGAGQITGTVRGPMRTPTIVARIGASGTKYNNVLLGAADIDLRYDGPKSALTFTRAVFTDGDRRLSLLGSVEFPDRGPSPRFDLAVDATNYPVDRAIKAVNLDFVIGGTGTGRLVITGTPESGKLTFTQMTIRQAEAELLLRGDVAWLPGEGNVNFNLDIAARAFPVADIVAFLDLGTLPISGQLTGTLHIEGPKNALEGAGSVTVRNGAIFGEPVEIATADIVFSKGRMRATSISIVSPAGQITGEAEFDLATRRFSYTIQTSALDLSRLKILEPLRNLFGGTVTLTSSGAGTMDQPELVVEARLNKATIQGLDLPPGTPPPSFYLAIRNGQLIIRGSLGEIVTVEGSGQVGPELAVDGSVRIAVTDIAKLVALSPNTAAIPASGSVVIDLRLGGRLTPLEALVVEGTVPTLNLRVSEHEFTPAEPLRFSMMTGRLRLDSFRLQRNGSQFAVTGFAELVEPQRLAIDLSGSIEAALIQLLMRDTRAEGHIGLAVAVRGTLDRPSVTGTAELQDAQVRFSGFPQLIDQIYGTLVFKGESIDIVGLRATLGGGEVKAGGSIALDGIKPRSLRVALEGTDVVLRYFEGVTLEGNFNLQVSGDIERAVVQGDVNVTRALYSRDFDLQQSILNVLLSRRGIVPVIAAPWQERVDLRIRLSAPDDALAVRNNIADVTGSGQLEVAGTLANPVILGTIDLSEGGTVTFQNIDYRVARGTISFQNPFRIDPYFDVTLEGRVSGTVSEIESGPIDLTVNITGTLDRITPTITSDPPASDITLFSLLGFGGLTRRDGPSDASAILVGQSLLLRGLTSALGSRILPFADAFTFDPGLIDTGSGADPKVTFEKRVSDDLRLLVVYNMTSHESREVIEWIVNRDWTLQFTRDGTNDEYRLDARFRRRYSGQWTWGRRGRNQDIFPLTGIAQQVGEATVAIAAPLPTTAVRAVAEGTTVAEVNIRADGPFDTDSVRNYVTIKPGEPLTRRALQESIKALFATGNFRDIRVDASPPAGQSTVTFSLFLNYRIGKIQFAGIGGGDRRRAERQLRIRQGDVLSLDAVDDSAVAVEQQLHEFGFLEAVVDPETEFVRAQNLAHVTFHVTPGPLAKVATVEIEGDLQPFTPEDLIRNMRQKPGTAFHRGDARTDAGRMKSFLVRREHRQADVEFQGHTYDEVSKTVTLNYTAEVGPIVRVEVEGVPRDAVRRQLPFRDRNQEYSEDVIDQAAENMVRAYQQRGYFHAAVDTESGLVGNVWVTTFKVNPGQRYRLADVTFSGNNQIPDRELEGVIQTSPRGGFRRLISRLFRRPTGVTSEQLNEDRDTLESHYRLQGFSEAVVANPVVSTRADGTMVVDFPVTEGPQTIVSEVRIEGTEQVEQSDLPDLQLEAGEPLNPQLEREDVIALQTFYADRGNAEAQVAPRITVSPDKTSAEVVFVITEGPKIEVNEVIVRGNTYTNDEVVLRQSQLDKGDPFSYTSILEAQRNLYRLGIFRRVDVESERTGTAIGNRNVVIQVEEGQNLTLSGSVGVRARSGAQDGQRDVNLRLSGAMAHRNLFGTGRFIGVEAVTAGTEEQDFFLTYREPFVGRYDVPVQVNIFQTADATIKERRIRQRGTSIEASKISRYRTRWSVQYQYKISECIEGQLCELADKLEIFVPGLDRSLLDIQISSVTPTFFWDKRDDVIDPHRGFFTSASIEYAFPLASAKTTFLKEFVQGAWYIPVSERSVFALSGRVGLIQQLGGDELGTPVAERFTAGGDTSHRAYPLDLLGTLCTEEEIAENPACAPTLFELCTDEEGDFRPCARDEDGRIVPLGGNALFIVNAEYRFPIFGTLGGAVFADVGNVFAGSSIRFSDLRYGVGVGIRYLSPVGPLRIDVGMPLSRRPYERVFAYSITLGYAF